MARALRAGGLYFAILFALGFALGTLRVLLLAPRLGEARAVLLEIPVMLAASWVVAGWLIRRFAVAPRAPARLVMGAAAFTLLLIAEAALSLTLFGRGLADHFAHYATRPGALGLAGQGVFALIPALRLLTDREPGA